MDDTHTDRFRAHFATFRDTLLDATGRWSRGRGAHGGKTVPAAVVAASLAVVAQRLQRSDYAFQDAALGLFRAMVFADDKMTARQLRALLDAPAETAAGRAS